MAIQLAKTLQTVPYTLYITSSIYAAPLDPDVIDITQDCYQSAGHYGDGFVAMMKLHEQITDTSTVATIKALIDTDYLAALASTESYLIANFPYYSGGTVVS